jgi:hypothetical protein
VRRTLLLLTLAEVTAAPYNDHVEPAAGRPRADGRRLRTRRTVAMSQESGPAASAPTPHASDAKAVQQALDRLREDQNFNAAVSAGMVAAVVGAIVWAFVTVLTKYQIGWMAVGVGFLVGYAVRRFGRGIEPRFGYLGAVLALIGCGLGNLLAVIGLVAEQEQIALLSLLGRVDWGAVPGIMAATFNPMDLLFYGIAVYEGYKFSFRLVGPAELGLPAQAGPAT